jgi:hypothetical protein
MKTFDDLEFTHHKDIKRWTATLKLDNGYLFSVIAGDKEDYWSLPYGTYQNDTFEVAVFGAEFDDNGDRKKVPLALYDDVLGWQKPIDISKLMRQFQLDGKAHEDLLVAMRNEEKEKKAKKSLHKVNN